MAEKRRIESVFEMVHHYDTILDIDGGEACKYGFSAKRKNVQG